MKIIHSFFLLAAFYFPSGASAEAAVARVQQSTPCVVTLAKGRKLAIRDQNGRRLSSTLPNGTKVTAVDFADGDGVGASKIAVNRKGKQIVLGWVSNNDVRCKTNL